MPENAVLPGKDDFFFRVRANAPNAQSVMDYIKSHLPDEAPIDDGTVLTFDVFRFLVNPTTYSRYHDVFVCLRYCSNNVSLHPRTELTEKLRLWLLDQLKSDTTQNIENFRVFRKDY